jgi:hypothetical protein
MSEYVAFKAKAHLLKLLGDELIGDDRLAIFELVKNSYDADATHVNVVLDVTSENPSIIVRDFSGDGMSKATIYEKWMEIGTDSKRAANRERSVKFNRLPLGEKGVGRLAVHKLGRKLTVNTRAEESPEFQINIDWPTLIDSAEYIEDTKIKVEELREPKVFTEGQTGTRIEIRDLNNESWTRGDIRRLKRLLTSIVSPFDEMAGFSVDLFVPGREKDLKDVLEAEDVLERAIWKYEFTIKEDGSFDYSYFFSPPSLFKGLSSRDDKKENIPLELISPSMRSFGGKEEKQKLLLSREFLRGVGPISGFFYIYSRDRKVLNAVGAYQDIINYLNEQTGVRVYRDGIRVFNYGEPNDDWLDLNAGRINAPGRKIGTNMVLANISLDLEKSYGLREKTNREGFDDNDAFKKLKRIVKSALEKFYQLHSNDREDITEYAKDGKKRSGSNLNSRFNENIDALKISIARHRLEKEMGGKVKQIESDFKQMREVTLSTGLAGMNLAVIFHEVERGVEDLNYAIKNNNPQPLLLERSDHLSKLLEGFAPLLKKNEQKKFSIKTLVNRVLDLSEHRFIHHNITASCPVLTGESPNFEIYAPFGLLQAALSNLIDNAIHWTRIKSETVGEDYKPAIRILSLEKWFKEGPALVVVDNGPGFDLAPDEAIQPFKTTRPSGMGVGLYYADKVMESIGGRLLITCGEDLDLPEPFMGGAVVLIFKRLEG